MVKVREQHSDVYSEGGHTENKCNNCGRVYINEIREYCPSCHSKNVSQLLNIEIQSVEISKNYVSKDIESTFLATRMAIIQAFTSKDIFLIAWIDCNKHNLDKKFKVIEIFSESFQEISMLLSHNDYEHWKIAIEDYIGNECMDELMDY